MCQPTRQLHLSVSVRVQTQPPQTMPGCRRVRHFLRSCKFTASRDKNNVIASFFFLYEITSIENNEIVLKRSILKRNVSIFTDIKTKYCSYSLNLKYFGPSPA